MPNSMALLTSQCPASLTGQLPVNPPAHGAQHLHRRLTATACAACGWTCCRSYTGPTTRMATPPASSYAGTRTPTPALLPRQTGNVEISFFLNSTYEAISYHAHMRAYHPTHLSPHLQRTILPSTGLQCTIQPSTGLQCTIQPSTGLQCTIQPSTGLQCSEYFPCSVSG
jgi:hypothetical protein